MKKNRSILFLILILACTLILAGCGSPQETKELTAYELVKSAVEKNAALESSEFETSIKMSMSISGISMEIPLNYSIKTAKEDGHTIASAVIKMDVMGETVETDVFVDKDFIYISENVQKMKVRVPVSSELASGYDISKMGQEIVKELPEDILKDVQIINNNDGSKTVNVEISEDRFNEIFKDYTDAALNSVLSELSDDDQMDITFSNAKASITVNSDGYVSDYNISFDMSMKISMQGISMDLTSSCESSCRYIKPGSKVTVDRPADLNDYKPISGE